MINAQHHVELGGVKYRLYESGEGAHYLRSQEPLRPPNAVAVQGTARQDLFQVRPDILLWSLTDWSGGEGQFVYDPQQPNRHLRLENVSAFDQPGSLRPGSRLRVAQTSGGDWTDEAILVVPGAGTMLGIDVAGGKVHKFDEGTGLWDGGTAIAISAPSVDGVDADANQIYFAQDSTGTIGTLDYNGASPGVLSGSTVGAPTSAPHLSLRQLNDYVYVLAPQEGKLYETPKVGGTTQTVIYQFPLDLTTWQLPPYDEATHRMTTGANRLYFFTSNPAFGTQIHEVTPTSAAGAGSGVAVATIPGVSATSIWYAAGLVYFTVGNFATVGPDRLLMYYDPDNGTYGVVDQLRPAPVEDGVSRNARGMGQRGGVLMTTAFFTEIVVAQGRARLMEMNLITGGIAQRAAQDTVSDGPSSAALVWNRPGSRYVFLSSSHHVSGTPVNLHANLDKFTTGESYFVSAAHDFGLSEEKVLSSVSIQCDSLPADWALRASYSVDNGAWVVIGSDSTTGSTGIKLPVSTDSTTVSFRSVRLKIEFVYSGAGGVEVDTAPTLKSIEVRAQVAIPQNVWRLRLDLTDDLGASNDSKSGFQKIQNIITAGQTGTVLAFKDGYPYPDGRGEVNSTEYDVLVDSYNLVLQRPGEGYVEVVLREVA